ncbi:family 43 glycosylhydrolase [Lutibacter sp. A64]|uniref:family 43 glycosylhydrolase n=1 Tax=Lutibacter sp. A64 TaxID=2918526 RepID=UPI001F054E34|nr:family 43 glycosylhydrolase [Lutibacter sp. A64]UMB54143.1 family 43 glycosylhydrolase [Lutibacter sp. A64]
MKEYKYFILVLITLNSSFIFAQNPILKGLGVSDPHIRVFNDTIYLYSGHDATPDDKIWTMRDWRVFSSTDLTDWKLRYKISPKENYMDDNSTDCWASDAASRNGKYYFYFSDRKRGVGVMTSDAPTGQFIDPLNKPLVAPMHDPTILIDDDANKTPYLIYGDKEGGGFHITKLNEDMISVAETPKPIKINGQEWKNAPHWMDKNYIFKHKDTYYLSWGRDYATSKNVYGPYESVGPLGEGHHLSEYAHGSFFKWKGQFYHIWCYYLKKGFKFRESIITYCHMDDDGEIVTDTNFLDQHFSNGVGQYNASWEKIEAEWFYEKSSEEILKTGSKEKGFTLVNIKNGDWIQFANVTFNKKYQKIIANISFDGKKGTLEIRTKSPKGKCIGKIKLSPENQLKTFQKIESKINNSIEVTDIYLVFKTEKGSLLKLDWVKFE